MKKLYILFFLTIGFLGNAQIINFPDVNFKNTLLLSNVAENLSGALFIIDSNNNGEIEVSEALQVGKLNLFTQNISNLSGIEYFSNLKELFCYDSQLTTLNLINNSNLEFLNCNNNDLTSIVLPNSSNLKSLICYGNQLTNLDLSNQFELINLECDRNFISSLNVSNCVNLYKLSCSSNQLTSLNISNNINLELLYCVSNQITNLDITNNSNLSELSCDSNQLTNLDVSNNFNLTKLGCSSNQLTNLNLSNNSNLEELFCGSNLLSNLDISNNPMLINLFCNSNHLNTINFTNNINLSSIDLNSNYLTSLDLTNQSNLNFLTFNNNQISIINLSNISNLQSLACNNNQLITLDLSNNSILQDLDCSSNPLQSIFIKNNSNETYYDYINDVQLLTFNFTNLPNLQYICADESQLNDIQIKILEYNYTNCYVNSYCSFTPGGTFYEILGDTKFDFNNDSCDVSDINYTNLNFSIVDGVANSSLISNQTGNYYIPVQTGIYTITPNLENPSYFNVSPTSFNVDFPTQASPFTQDFCVTPNGVKSDIEVILLPTTPARPGFDATYKLIYRNKGNQVENGSVSLTFDDTRLDHVSSNPVYYSSAVNNFTWNYTNLQPFETREIALVLNVNSPIETPAVNNGDVLNYTATITTSNTDETPLDNTFTLDQTVVGSYDPNDKTCLEGETIAPSEVGNYVHYLIRFENTGTYPAENIVVKDMIDLDKFDIATLVPLKSSHDYFTRINGNKVEFIFENINLDFNDATNDGYVLFKIKTLPSLVLGDTFTNNANIYFDYNFPITTNTYTTTVAALSTQDFDFGTYFTLYPNPAKDVLNIQAKQDLKINSIEIYNQLGQIVMASTNTLNTIDVSNLASGTYFVKINTQKGSANVKFVKE